MTEVVSSVLFKQVLNPLNRIASRDKLDFTQQQILGWIHPTNNGHDI